MSESRPLWLTKIKDSWIAKPIVWLAGVRRIGKTTLAKSLNADVFLNCDMPSVRARLDDPESFFKEHSNGLIVFDEIHQLNRPDEILKIAADEYKDLKILATGSSTLAATKKFKDTLTGRKKLVHLLPVLVDELPLFGIKNLKIRLLQGGLPPALLSPQLNAEFYLEWLDSYYARDVQELFRVEKRQPFLKLLELLLIENGSYLDITRVARLSGISRPTAIHYLNVLEITKVISIIRPCSKNSTQTIISQPKIYGFDTGFVNFVKGIEQLRTDDCGLLLENLVLETLQSLDLNVPIQYWRTKNQMEVDFIIPAKRDVTHTIECKWSANAFDPAAVISFRKHNPQGKNIVVCEKIQTPSRKTIKGLVFQFYSISELRSQYPFVG